MSNLDAEIQEIAERIERLVRDAYKRGENDAIDRLLRAARSDRDDAEQGVVTAVRPDGEEREGRKRAPKGAVQALVTRALGDGIGKTPDEIKARAEHGHQRMIARSSIRAHLRTGEKDGRYRKEGGRWYLAGRLPQEREETADPAEGRAVSDLWPNQEGQR